MDTLDNKIGTMNSMHMKSSQNDGNPALQLHLREEFMQTIILGKKLGLVLFEMDEVMLDFMANKIVQDVALFNKGS